ncbi:hypothetical protein YASMINEVIRUS_439 [Yasminevirus sp. GU-2018]|uniref:Uncharacterized protein n=1 Tax=Yasminevirus sp. GU-2018 TaxID=2420051 RepID=A0A5K0UA54_9VIRU|nr:hypothetical protein YASMINEVIRUS_439 [Yasminevirus sp. GU-2018]
MYKRTHVKVLLGMSGSLLDEYVKVTMAIEKVQNKISQYKETIEKQIENAKNSEEEEMYIDEFRRFTQNIKNDHEITNKYRQLKKRQRELRDLLTLQQNSQLSTQSLSQSVSQSPSQSLQSHSDVSDAFERTIRSLTSKYESNTFDLNDLSSTPTATSTVRQTPLNIKTSSSFVVCRKGVSDKHIEALGEDTKRSIKNIEQILLKSAN